MKRHFIAIAIGCIAIVSIMSCKQSTIREDMSNEEKLEILDIKINKKPNDASLYFDRAKIYVELQRYNEALNDLTKATELDKNNTEYLMLLGDTYFRVGNMEYSAKAIEHLLEIEPDNTDALLKLGEVEFYTKDYDRAMETLSKVTAKDKNNLTALHLKSFIYKETGDTNSAITYLQKIINLYSDYVPGYVELGILMSDLNNPLAVEYLNSALNIDPQNTNAMYALAMYYQIQKKMELAESLYKQILDINANDKDAWHNRGYIELFHYGDYETAIEYFNQAIRCDNQFIEAYTNRGIAYELNGDKTNAKISFEEALNIDPAYEPAREGISRL